MSWSRAPRPTFLTGFDPQRYVKESRDEVLPAEDLGTRMMQILSLPCEEEFDQLTGEWLLKELLNREEVTILWDLYWKYTRKELPQLTCIDELQMWYEQRRERQIQLDYEHEQERTNNDVNVRFSSTTSTSNTERSSTNNDVSVRFND
jgi:hypothetical protein